MKKIGWLENFLEPLEKKAKDILKTQSNIREDSQFKKLNKGKGISRWQTNPKYQSAEDLLRQTQSFKELILKNGTPRDVIYKLTWILGIAYDMGWPVPSQYVIGRFKGGKAPKKAEGFILACMHALKESPKKDSLSLWRFIRKNYSDTAEDLTIEYDQDVNKFYERYRDGRSRPISFRTFQRYISDLKKKSQ